MKIAAIDLFYLRMPEITAAADGTAATQRPRASVTVTAVGCAAIL